ncbi:MAG: hypothetical protein A3J24_10460 [Deltaproteobacteria bacterium RIFCSPLOWO2_02_FULL_53_8]|nr:MAG: hypothetical protein A3J24_10460 [Deltaproteobacteria bacterium RIFCSPLOWO2_02_FULL_53_8]
MKTTLPTRAPLFKSPICVVAFFARHCGVEKLRLVPHSSTPIIWDFCRLRLLAMNCSFVLLAFGKRPESSLIKF